jgi:hypothetical protein
VPSDSFLLLRFHAPISLSLCLHGETVMSSFRHATSAVASHVPIESLRVNLVLLKIFNVQVQVSFSISPTGIVKQIRINEVGCMKLKIRRVINQQFFRSWFLIVRYWFGHVHSIFLQQLRLYKRFFIAFTLAYSTLERLSLFWTVKGTMF